MVGGGVGGCFAALAVWAEGADTLAAEDMHGHRMLILCGRADPRNPRRVLDRKKQCFRHPQLRNLCVTLLLVARQRLLVSSFGSASMAS